MRVDLSSTRAQQGVSPHSSAPLGSHVTYHRNVLATSRVKSRLEELLKTNIRDCQDGKRRHAQYAWEKSTTWLSTGVGKAVYATLATSAILASTILSMSMILPAGLLLLSLCLPFLYIYAKKSVAYLLALTGLKSAGRDVKLSIINSGIRDEVCGKCDQLEKDQESRDQRFEEIGGYFSQDGLEKLKGEAAKSNITIAERLEFLRGKLQFLFQKSRMDLTSSLNVIGVDKEYRLGIMVSPPSHEPRELVDLRFICGDSLLRNFLREEQRGQASIPDGRAMLEEVCRLHADSNTNGLFACRAVERQDKFNKELDTLFSCLGSYIEAPEAEVKEAESFLNRKFASLKDRYMLESANVRDCADLTRLFVKEHEDELHNHVGTLDQADVCLRNEWGDGAHADIMLERGFVNLAHFF